MSVSTNFSTYGQSLGILSIIENLLNIYNFGCACLYVLSYVRDSSGFSSAIGQNFASWICNFLSFLPFL